MTAPGLYRRVERFYLRQWRLVDAGDAEACGRTFTEDAVVVRHASPDRMGARGAAPHRSGRAAIITALARVVGLRAEEGVVRRHWVGGLLVRPSAVGGVRTRYLTLVIETPAGGRPSVHNSAVVEDLLVPAEDTWLVRHRRITHDDAVVPAGRGET